MHCEKVANTVSMKAANTVYCSVGWDVKQCTVFFHLHEGGRLWNAVYVDIQFMVSFNLKAFVNLPLCFKCKWFASLRRGLDFNFFLIYTLSIWVQQETFLESSWWASRLILSTTNSHKRSPHQSACSAAAISHILPRCLQVYLFPLCGVIWLDDTCRLNLKWISNGLLLNVKDTKCFIFSQTSKYVLGQHLKCQ